MTHLLTRLLFASLLTAPLHAVDEFPPTEDSKPKADVAKGEMIKGNAKGDTWFHALPFMADQGATAKFSIR